ncbi:glycosyltransferase family 25 protein [Wenxinia saemankumensis]|uniref:Glycosyl transferase, family 25 n=1 Tax=Wenxinia saemankumensis TaxID=1447782 RepID=A0A1M6BZC0_9RHOB|nr:glycosyltransferase family 25 protein [Wenxinia saemankumensis]SHI53798.1 glycosyl transferase, family 25 [Wenxinia saemankumensis]
MPDPTPRALCINLARRDDRRTRMLRVAAGAGLALDWIDALDATDPAAAPALAALPPDGPTGRLGDGARACTLSHARAWRAAAESGADWTIVLEDDVILAPDSGAVLAALLRDPPQAVDIVKLEAGGTVPLGIVVGAELARPGGRAIRRCHQLATDSAAYAISAAGARQALARVSACNTGVDHFLFYPRPRRGGAGLRQALMVPPLAVQDRALASDIKGRRYGARDRLQRLRRGLYEGAQAGGLLRALASGARVVKAPYAADPRAQAPIGPDQP